MLSYPLLVSGVRVHLRLHSLTALSPYDGMDGGEVAPEGPGTPYKFLHFLLSSLGFVSSSAGTARVGGFSIAVPNKVARSSENFRFFVAFASRASMLVFAKCR